MISALALQELVVALCVVAAAMYALRKLLPRLSAGLLRAVARVFDRLGQPSLAARLRPARVAASGCGSGCNTCGSCDSPKPAAPAEQPIRFQR